MMEKGTVPIQYKGKSLSEIDINVDGDVYPDEEEIEGTITLLYVSEIGSEFIWDLGNRLEIQKRLNGEIFKQIYF